MEKPVVFFDGHCNLCNGLIKFIIRHDKRKVFRFAPLQGTTASTLRNVTPYAVAMQSILLRLPDGSIFQESTAVLRILRKLGFPFNLAYGLIIFPRFLRDPIYRLVGANRYKWFGKTEECMVPTPELMERFLP